MTSPFVATAYSFYGHNAPLIFFGGMAAMALLHTLKKPSRANILVFAAFLVLTFGFEYDKHLIAQIKSHWLDLIFPEGERFTKYNFLKIFFSQILPIAIDTLGWGLLAFSLFFLKDDKK